ncbi:zinc ribbon domain-containing protein [Streptomyces sp. NPDC060065]|uniref:zinc ribbon domain-containing protein n=1 Tax=Streptomyces sp. NPDC060065 TaxID=3347050 RepID=UPI0036CF98BB
MLHTPTLRATRAGRIALDLPHSRPVPAVKASGHRVGLGFDWGVNTLLTGTLGRLAGRGSAQRVLTDGRPLIFDATTISATLHRLRTLREHLAAKRDHCQALADGLGSPHPVWGEHLERAQVLAVEHVRVCARIRHLNSALARAAARWAVDQAVALGASVIYLEDLATLEARGHRKGNARLSGQVRGTVAEAIRHLGAKAGIAVVTVPPRGTSKLCPGCLSPLTHHPAPDRLHERGWKWAHCTRCGLSMDRDHAAGRRIVSRGLLAQTQTVTDRATGIRTIRTTIEGTVCLVRRPKKTTRRLRRQLRAEVTPPRPAGPKTTKVKGHPTRSRPSGPRGRRVPRATAAPDQDPGPKSSRRTSDVRTVPATAPTPGAVQRPAGHDTTTPAAFRPVPGHGVPVPCRTEEDLLLSGRVRLSRRTCRQRTSAAERTGFHHLHATEVHSLTPRFGPPDGNRRWPRRVRKAWKPQAHTEFQRR